MKADEVRAIPPVVPSTPEQIEAVAKYCRKLVNRRALLAAGVAVVPVPGIDWVTDIGVLVRVLPQINEAFGLTPEQIERLSPDRQVVIYKVLSARRRARGRQGRHARGRAGPAQARWACVSPRSRRPSTCRSPGRPFRQRSTYGALKFVCEQHIRQCMDIAKQLQLPAPLETAERVA